MSRTGAVLLEADGVVLPRPSSTTSYKEPLLPTWVPSPLMCVRRRDDKKVMRRLANALRLITRGLLWLTIALPVAWLTLWLSERLLHADVFGPELVMSGWFWFAWIVAALVVGNAVAYGCDRIFMQQRERSRPLRRAS